MEQVTAFASLRDVLASIFILEAETRVVVFDAGLDASSIDFSGQAVLTWHSVLRQSVYQNRISHLLVVITKKYPTFAPLHDAIRNYCHSTGVASPPGLLPAPAMSSGNPVLESSVPMTSEGSGKTKSTLAVANVQAWFRSVGFVENPFADLDASRETMLSDFFVETPLYLELVGDNLTTADMIISGERGSGKSALHRMVSLARKSVTSQTSILSVELNCCCWLSQAAERNWQVSALREFARTIFQSTVENIVHSLLLREPSVSQSILQNLKWFWLVYGATVADPDYYYTAFVGDTQIDRLRFSEAWKASQISNLLSTTKVWDRPGVRNLAALVDTQPTKPVYDPLSTGATYRQLVEIAASLDLTSTQVLVDCQGKSPSSSSLPNSVVPIVATILAEPSLRGSRELVFQFLLTPDDVHALKQQHSEIDAVNFRIRDLQWRDDDLRKLLSQRVIAFSDGKIADITQLCDDQMASDIGSLLIRSAQGVPRSMLQMFEKLVIVHCLRNADQLLLSRDDWQAAQLAFGL